MKKFFLMMLSVCMMQFAWANEDRAVSFEQLPQAARSFIQTHFAGKKVAFSKMDKDWLEVSYSVVLVDGSKVEFDRKGNWKEIKCKSGYVPEVVLPQPICRYVTETYPDEKVVKIDKDDDHHGYEVQLSNHWEITFDAKFNVVDMGRYDD